MSFQVDPQLDACRAWMPRPEPAPPGPPSVPLVCHMPEGHDGPHSNERRPSALSRRWEGDGRSPLDDIQRALDLFKAQPYRPSERLLSPRCGLWDEHGKCHSAMCECDCHIIGGSM